MERPPTPSAKKIQFSSSQEAPEEEEEIQPRTNLEKEILETQEEEITHNPIGRQIIWKRISQLLVLSITLTILIALLVHMTRESPVIQEMKETEGGTQRGSVPETPATPRAESMRILGLQSSPNPTSTATGSVKKTESCSPTIIPPEKDWILVIIEEMGNLEGDCAQETGIRLSWECMSYRLNIVYAHPNTLKDICLEITEQGENLLDRFLRLYYLSATSIIHWYEWLPILKEACPV
jgi:hypothetical protein